jgi:hypothetical protein
MPVPSVQKPTRTTTKRKRPGTKPSHQIAREAVTQYFAALATDRGILMDDTTSPSLKRLNEAFDKVARAVEREHGEQITDETENYVTEEIGIYAGYLVGVQVGLRLRNIRGAR